MGKILHVFNPGHGGGVHSPDREDLIYLTPGKRGFGINEGIYNREIASLLAGLAVSEGRNYLVTNPGPVDIRKKDRIVYAEKLLKVLQNEHIVSEGLWSGIHCNAAGNQPRHYDANGFVIYHYPGSEKGKAFAQILHSRLEYRLNRVGINGHRGIKTSRWMYELYKPKMTSVVIEMGFMTNHFEAKILKQEATKAILARAIFEAHLEFESIIP